MIFLQRNSKKGTRVGFKEGKIWRVNSVLWITFIYFLQGFRYNKSPLWLQGRSLPFALIIAITWGLHLSNCMYNKEQIKTPEAGVRWRMSTKGGAEHGWGSKIAIIFFGGGYLFFLSLLFIFECNIPVPKLTPFADSCLTGLKEILYWGDQDYRLNVIKNGLQKLQHIIINSFLIG